jgi:hypothetical protein
MQDVLQNQNIILKQADGMGARLPLGRARQVERVADVRAAAAAAAAATRPPAAQLGRRGRGEQAAKKGRARERAQQLQHRAQVRGGARAAGGRAARGAAAAAGLVLAAQRLQQRRGRDQQRVQACARRVSYLRVSYPMIECRLVLACWPRTRRAVPPAAARPRPAARPARAKLRGGVRVQVATPIPRDDGMQTSARLLA